MRLAELIRKKPSSAPATAIPAIPATEDGDRDVSVARIATIAVAIPPTENTTSRRWRIRFPELASIEVWFTPETTRAGALAACDGAIEAVAIEDCAGRQVTAAEADELRELITAILPDATAADCMEALTVALSEPDAALECFRSLARGGA